MEGLQRELCEGHGEKLWLHAGWHARVVYIKREFTVYNKKVPKPWTREGSVMMQGSFLGGVASH
jgi:hypothetical protein